MVWEKLNNFWFNKTPCIFCLDFEGKSPLILTDFDSVLFNFNGTRNYELKEHRNISLEKTPASFEEYKKAYDIVYREISYGNSFLTNLTLPTDIKLSCSLEELFLSVKAPYTFYKPDEFLFFSPESFIKIENGIISSFPMKGTIDANVPNAEQKILEDRKEKAEHATIVDLIRNDLSLVASDVRVKRYRYLTRVKTQNTELIQVSSEISGKLNECIGLGDVLKELLPAGSISGAPKRKTVEIIQKAENSPRGFFTGVCGIFDGEKVDSCVMIRFIEKQKDGSLRYRSGGGITINSDPQSEYQELIDKVYVPSF